MPAPVFFSCSGGTACFISSLGRAHSVNRTPHIAVSVVALATLVPRARARAARVAVFDIFGWIVLFASCGFILSYILVSLAAPIYLYTHHSPSIATVLSAVAAIVLLLIALIGNLYPVPAAPIIDCHTCSSAISRRVTPGLRR